MSNDSVCVALVMGSLDNVKFIRMAPRDIGKAMRVVMGCERVDIEQVSPVHTIYRPLDGEAARQRTMIIVRATDASGKTLVDIGPEDIRQMPVILRDHERSAGQRAAFMQAMAATAQRAQE